MPIEFWIRLGLACLFILGFCAVWLVACRYVNTLEDPIAKRVPLYELLIDISVVPRVGR
jgi:hypothetical protein